MAGNWIRMRIDLGHDPDVISIAGKLGISEDEVVGKLLRFWGWVSSHSTDGNARGVTNIWIDRYIGVTGFAAALLQVGWLADSGGGITVPHFERYLSEGAKQRGLTARRVAKSRGKSNDIAVTESLQEPLLEKRREEKEKKKEEYTREFEQWWKVYPRKTGKGKAFPAYQKALRFIDRDTLLEATRRFAISAAGKAGRFCPYPANWLNAKRWDDDPTEWEREHERKGTGPDNPNTSPGVRYDPDRPCEPL